MHKARLLLLFTAIVICLTTSAQKLVQSFVETNISGSTTFGCSVSGAGDVNNDGFNDIIIGASTYNSKGRAYIFYGGATLDTFPDIIMSGETINGYYGNAVSSIGDVNDDGFDDVIVGEVNYSGIGSAYIYFGGVTMDNIPDITLVGENIEDRFGETLSGAGDVNNDGYDDVILGASCYNKYKGRSYIYFGGSAMDNIADIVLTGRTTGSSFGYSVSGAGDVNNDGFGDVIIGGLQWNKGRAYIFFGNSILDTIPDLIMTGEGTYNDFGCSVSGTGDINNDGFDDVVVGDYYNSSHSGRSYIYYGNSVMDSIPDVKMTGEGTENNFGSSVSGAGDVNNDGFDDVIIGACEYDNGVGRAYIYFGASLMDNTPDITMTGETLSSRFGYSVSAIGDLNNDGFDDIIVGADRSKSFTGLSYVYLGGSSEDNVADLTMIGEPTGLALGSSVSSAGDLNNDGFDDIIVGAPGYNVQDGRTYIYFGALVMDNIPDVILTGNNEGFGNSVSGAGDVNNDGFDDVIVGARDYNSTGRTYIYYGGSVMDNIPDKIMTGTEVNNNFGCSVSGAGDVNNDGFDDVIIGGFGFNSDTGRSYIYFGGSDMDTIPDITMQGEKTNNYFGWSVSGAGDVNNDGFDDVVVGAIGSNKAYIYQGGSAMDNLADEIITGEVEGIFFGSCVSGAGDVNNDGFDDVVMGASGYNSHTGRSYIYYGGITMENTPDVILTGEIISSRFGYSVSGACDINKDGIDDVIVGSIGYTTSVIGRSYIYYGSSNMDNIADITIQAEEVGDCFGGAVSNAGDVDNDGFDDVIIGAYAVPLNGKAYIYSYTPFPIVKTTSISSMTANSVVANGYISYLGTTNPTAHGFCWNTTGTPTITDSHTEEGAAIAIGSYSSNISGLITSTTYYVRAYATNVEGTSYGKELSCTPKYNQSITFNSLAKTSYGNANFNLNANASSGLAVSLISSNTKVATVSGTLVEIVGAGNTTIIASQPGNNSYNGAENVEQVLTINKAVLTATANNASKTYGESNPSFIISYTGFVNNEEPTVLTSEPTVSTTASATTGAGTAAITVSGGIANNYSFNYVNGTLTINKAVLTATANNASKTYGESNPSFIISYTGFVNNEEPTVLTSEPTVSTTASATTGAGTAAITVSGGIANNYNFNYVNGTLTINKAELTATANNASKTYGESNPSFIISYTGFVNNEEPTVLTSEPTVSSTASATTRAGTAAITVSGGIANNYSFNYVNGTLTINKAVLTATANNASKTYGESNPSFIISYTGFVNNEEPTVLTSEPTVSTTASATTGAGTAAITVSGGIASNYSFNYVNGTLTINKAVLTATANNASKTYGESNPSFIISYTGFVNNEEPTVLTSEPTVSTTASATTGAGTAAITVSGGIANNYNFNYVNGTLTINKAELTASANNASKTYGESNPSFTLSYTGFVNNEEPTVLTSEPTVSTTASATTGAGTAAITVSGGIANNYSFNYVSGTLTINKAELIASANNASKTYGESNPSFIISYTGFVNNEEPTVLTTEPTVSTTASATTGAGTAAITVSGGIANNYSFNYVSGTLTINKAELTASANNASKTYGESNPSFTLSYTGFVNNEEPTVLTTEPTVSSTASATTRAGTAAITVSGGIANNYSFNYVSGTLTINKAELIASANNASKTYGESNPSFTISYTGFVNNEEPTVLTSEPTVSSTASATTGSGTAAITVSGGIANNYSFNYVSGTLTINKAVLTVTATDKTKYKGENNPELTMSFADFVNKDGESNIDVLPTLFCTANSTSPIGNYAIIISSAEDDNYEFVYVDGVLTILEITNLQDEFDILLTLHPNPSSKYIIFNWTDKMESIVVLEIYKISGDLIFKTNLYKKSTSIDVTEYTQGIYIAKVFISNKIYSKVFFKE